MKRSTLFLILFIYTELFSADTLTPVPESDLAYIEAVVTKTYDCGFLLRLNNGQLIKPINLPRKFQIPNEKVRVVIDEMTNIYNSSCNAQKEVHIDKIEPFRSSNLVQPKF